MTNSENGGMGAFNYLVQSLPDYSELIIAILIVILLLVSMDEIIGFIHMLKDIFTYKGLPFS